MTEVLLELQGGLKFEPPRGRYGRAAPKGARPPESVSWQSRVRHGPRAADQRARSGRPHISCSRSINDQAAIGLNPRLEEQRLQARIVAVPREARISAAHEAGPHVMTRSRQATDRHGLLQDRLGLSPRRSEIARFDGDGRKPSTASPTMTSRSGNRPCLGPSLEREGVYRAGRARLGASSIGKSRDDAMASF